MAVELFNNGKHIVHAFYDLVDEKTTGAVQSNQFLIVDHGHGALIDPGGTMTYTGLLMDMQKYFSSKDLDYIFASHPDPDIIASVNKWFVASHCKVMISSLWTRFVPHFTTGKDVSERDQVGAREGHPRGQGHPGGARSPRPGPVGSFDRVGPVGRAGGAGARGARRHGAARGPGGLAPPRSRCRPGVRPSGSTCTCRRSWRARCAGPRGPLRRACRLRRSAPVSGEPAAPTRRSCSFPRPESIAAVLPEFLVYGALSLVP